MHLLDDTHCSFEADPKSKCRQPWLLPQSLSVVPSLVSRPILRLNRVIKCITGGTRLQRVLQHEFYVHRKSRLREDIQLDMLFLVCPVDSGKGNTNLEKGQEPVELRFLSSFVEAHSAGVQ